VLSVRSSEAEQVALRRDWSDFPKPAATTPAADLTPSEKSAPPDAPDREAPSYTAPGATPVPASPAMSRQTPTNGALDFKILGVLGKLYVLMENSNGLVLVDQHAAHERILFEEMRRRMETHGVPTQRLLLPLTLQVTPRDTDWLLSNLSLLERAGIALEPFGPGTFKVDALPTFVRGSDPTQLLHDVIDELRETTAQSSRLRLGEEMIAKTVCRHAVKANDYLREPELVRLIQDLLACDLPYCCPHGRPTMIQMSYGELEKKFGRKV
jgi:DNA mismatch repair protein MutL